VEYRYFHLIMIVIIIFSQLQHEFWKYGYAQKLIGICVWRFMDTTHTPPLPMAERACAFPPIKQLCWGKAQLNKTTLVASTSEEFWIAKRLSFSCEQCFWICTSSAKHTESSLDLLRQSIYLSRLRRRRLSCQAARQRAADRQDDETVSPSYMQALELTLASC